MASDKYSRLFDTQHLNTDLKKRSLRGGAVTLTTQGMSFVIQLGSTMILARILTPDDYGMMAMVVAITGLAGILINLGLSTATIQRAEINHSQVSTLFWINAGIGAALMLLVSGLAPVIAWFYKTPELKWMAITLSCNFLINGMAVQHQALLNRQMRFVVIAVIQIGSMVAGISVAIMMALQGFGYWALVANSITISVCTVMGAWIAVGWWPGLPRRDAGVMEMVKFGSDIVGFNIINYFARNLDNILIGRYHGSGALGLYSKAYQLLMMPITNLRDPLQKVALPTLSRLKDRPEEYKNYFLKIISILSFISMPLVVFMFVFAENIINLTLGEQWSESVGLFRILSLVALIQPVTSIRGTLLLSRGEGRKLLIIGLLTSLIVCFGIVFGVPWGAKGVAIGYVCAVYLAIIPTNYFIFKNSPVRTLDFFLAMIKPITFSIFIGLITYIVFGFIVIKSDFINIVIGFIFFILLYLFLYCLLSSGRSQISDYYCYFKIAFGKS